MKVEEVIKQTKPFKSEFQKLIVNIQVTASWQNSSFALLLKPFGITPHQYNVLRILRGKFPEGYCNHEITERMIDKSSNSTRIVDKLLEKKLIHRTEDKTDRRLVDIRINKKGLDLIEKIDATPNPTRTKAKTFNVEKAKLMNEWLNELRED
ncbi:MAG: MarR family transcriptional regulator [bacterium]|nr:MarR family transcriptional regulator [bacterium]